MAENVEVLTHQNILMALLVILAVIWVSKQIMDFVITLRTIRKPHEREVDDLATRQAACDKKFNSDMRRLDALEGRMDTVEEGQRVLCRGVYEVLGHMLHNGNKEGMQDASNELFDFLNEKKRGMIP